MESKKKSESSTSQKSRKPNSQTSLELLYNISREFAAALDLEEVLERVLLLAMETVGATTGSIIVIDDSGKPVESTIVTGDQIHSHTTQRLRVTLERGLAGWVLRNRQAVLIKDTSKDERWLARRYEPEPQSVPKSVVSSPLLVRERPVGVLTLSHQNAGFFKDDHLSLVQAIADQAGISVLNARLYAESQRQARVMSALAESSAVITASLNLEDVLVRILEQISTALQVPAVSLALIDQEKEALVFKAAIGWETAWDTAIRIPLENGICGWTAKEGRGIVVADVHKDQRYDPETEARTGLDVRSIACAPIRSKGQVIGVLEAIITSTDRFDADALFVLTGIGSLAGTAIRHAQLFERLQAAHKRYQELFEDSIDPILISDCDGQIVEANRQAVRSIGEDLQTSLDKNVHELHDVNKEKLGPGCENLKAGDTLCYESILHVSKGEDIPIQVYVRQVEIDKVLHLQWIFRDISERKNLDVMREDLQSMIYHDLRSPLANVISSLDTAASMFQEDIDTNLSSLLGIAIRSSHRIDRLTASLLDIQRLEAGHPLVNSEAFSFSLLVEDTLEDLHPSLKTKKQELIIELSEDLPMVIGDADMIQRVLINLLENASKYLPQDGKITLGAHPEDEYLHIFVQDNGPGIPDEERERIFDKYTRLGSDDTPKGFGLGLHYCRLAIEAHGGRIWVEPIPDSGAQFNFTLPVIIDSSHEDIKHAGN
jgi:two-component system, NtrC family, sensor histidine kinase KinB